MKIYVTKPIGPGPGAYGLPSLVGYQDHDARKDRRPQYSMGMRTKILGQGQPGPGPAAYALETMYRDGKKFSPHYSFGLRTKLQNKNCGPGPGAHDVTEFLGPRAPKYTFGLKTGLKSNNTNPGPNAYTFNVRQTKPGIPAYSMGRRNELSGKNKSPGPAAYYADNLNVYKSKSPGYSMGLKTKSDFSKNVSPGPNAYTLQLDKGPAYSFGVRHFTYKPPMIVACDN